MSESMKERLRGDLNGARRERDKQRTMVLSTILSDVRNREIEIGHDATDVEVTEVLTRAIKRRKEASEQMRAGHRPELADQEDSEARLLTGYLPEPLSEAEVRALVREAVVGGAQNVGAVMGKIMPRIKGVFDGKDATRIVREELEKG